MKVKLKDVVVMPAYGICDVVRKEPRTIGGQKTSFFVLHARASGASILLPEAGVDEADIRKVASTTDIDLALEVLSSAPEISSEVWNVRHRELIDKAKTGDLRDTATVIRDIHGARRGRDMTYGEKKMFDRAVATLAAEISVARGIPEPAAENTILDRLA